MDLVDLKEEIKLLNETTIPRLEAMVARLCAQIEKFNGASLTLKLRSEDEKAFSDTNTLDITRFPSDSMLGSGSKL